MQGSGGRVRRRHLLSLARYETRGREELVTLAYTGPAGPAYCDHPAEADPAGTWRPDDGGTFSVESYQPLFAFRTKAGHRSGRALVAGATATPWTSTGRKGGR